MKLHLPFSTWRHSAFQSSMKSCRSPPHPINISLHSMLLQSVFCWFLFDSFCLFPFFVFFIPFFIAVGSRYLHPGSHSFLSSLVTSEKWQGGRFNHTGICLPIISGLAVWSQCCTGPDSLASWRSMLVTVNALTTAHLHSSRCHCSWNQADRNIILHNAAPFQDIMVGCFFFARW